MCFLLYSLLYLEKRNSRVLCEVIVMRILTLKDIRGKHLWEYEESLEEVLGIISPYDIDINILCEDRDREKRYVYGDILMVPQWNSSVNGRVEPPYRVVVVDGVEERDRVTYTGRVLSSQIRNSNKYNSKYPNNVYIDDYDTILSTGKAVGRKPVYINISDIITFTNNDLSDSGTWKGHISDEFDRFIKRCISNYQANEMSNKDVFWEGTIV